MTRRYIESLKSEPGASSSMIKDWNCRSDTRAIFKLYINPTAAQWPIRRIILLQQAEIRYSEKIADPILRSLSPLCALYQFRYSWTVATWLSNDILNDISLRIIKTYLLRTYLVASKIKPLFDSQICCQRPSTTAIGLQMGSLLVDD